MSKDKKDKKKDPVKVPKCAHCKKNLLSCKCNQQELVK